MFSPSDKDAKRKERVIWHPKASGNSNDSEPELSTNWAISLWLPKNVVRVWYRDTSEQGERIKL